MSSSRRQALVTISSAAATVLPALGQTPSPKVLSAAQFELLQKLTERIIPRTETPGAIDAGVAGFIDASLATDAGRKDRWQAALTWFAANGGDSVETLTRISKETDTEGARHFRLLKGDTIDTYYSTIEGLKTELGWNANTYLPEFKGCTHPEHQV
ncbi:hypothetical protein F183_A46440 [Bryobacterales bacterium F-183]|nr:hypothetical protein F183_A46440 [Bryobacterales bacterium F-183]